MADHAGNVSDPATVDFTVDTIPPVITITAPEDGAYTKQSSLTIAGAVGEPALVTVNGHAVSLGINHDFTWPATLVEGNNAFAFQAVDRAGNSGYASVSVILDTVPPAEIDLTAITVAFADGKAEVIGENGSVEPGGFVTITNMRTGGSITVTADAEGAFMALIAAEAGDPITIQVADRAGNATAEIELPIFVDPGPEPIPGYVPPDPASVAPELDPTVSTTVFAATDFLYAGQSKIQFGVEPGTIEAKRVAVLRGKVTDEEGEPLSGVTITVHNHPEYGWTGTRADGVFDIVTNGGGYLTVNYEKPGYLPVQRKINAPWDDYAWLSDVVMIRLDERVTSIDLNADAPIQTARGSVVTDQDGTRQATMFFPRGLSAHMVLPDGSTELLDTLSVRATEYTIGPDGPERMPGELPPTSGYTYAVELSVDEAIEAGAREVRFDRPVPFYVENFVGFPVGGIVPAGWYDRERAAWIPSANGRVIQILAIENGMAVLDVDGSGQPAGPDALAGLGISDDERRELAVLYAPGASLWRTPVEHFTPWDCNWPWGPPDDAESPPDEKPEFEDENNPDDPCEQAGCIIEAETQVLGESIPVTGTPYSLNYRSDRVRGYIAPPINIPVSGPSVPGSLRRIDLTIQVAGQVHDRSFAPTPNLQATFQWDGKDSNGRPVTDAKLSYRLRYVYQAVYYEPDEFGSAFGRAGTAAVISGNRSTSEIYFTVEHTVPIMAVPRDLGLGGWTLEPHHLYSASEAMLYLGDGRRNMSGETGSVIDTVATPLQAYKIAVAPDGTFYIADI